MNGACSLPSCRMRTRVGGAMEKSVRLAIRSYGAEKPANAAAAYRIASTNQAITARRCLTNLRRISVQLDAT